jgi:uncharacterized membrane protein
LHAAHQTNRAIFEQIQEEKAKASRILQTNPFDGIAYQDQVDTIHQLRGRSLQHIVDTVKKLAPTLNDNERAALAEIMSRPPPPEPLAH